MGRKIGSILGAVLAISLMAVGTAPFAAAQAAPNVQETVPPVQQGHDEPCQRRGTFEGWLWAPNPQGEQALVSQIGYRLVEGGHLGEFVNGIDAYVLDFGCTVNNNPGYCIQRIAPSDSGSLLDLKLVFTERDDDLRVTWFDSGWDLIRTDDKDGQSDFCMPEAPADGQYAVIWTSSGTPRGVHASNVGSYSPPDTTGNGDESLPGPFTLKFCLDISVDFDCPKPLDQDGSNRD